MRYKSIQASNFPLYGGYTSEKDPYKNAYKQKQVEYDQNKTEKKDKVISGLKFDDGATDSIDTQISNVKAQIKEVKALLLTIDDTTVGSDVTGDTVEDTTEDVTEDDTTADVTEDVTPEDTTEGTSLVTTAVDKVKDVFGSDTDTAETTDTANTTENGEVTYEDKLSQIKKDHDIEALKKLIANPGDITEDQLQYLKLLLEQWSTKSSSVGNLPDYSGVTSGEAPNTYRSNTGSYRPNSTKPPQSGSMLNLLDPGYDKMIPASKRYYYGK